MQQDADVDDGSPVWTRRLRLTLDGPQHAGRYSVPIVVPHRVGTQVFATQEGQVLRYCEDSIRKSTAHRLLWIDYPLQVAGHINFMMYSGPDSKSCFEATTWESQAQFSLPEETLIFAEYFREGKLEKWEGSLQTPTGGGGSWMPAQNLPTIYRDNCSCRAAALSSIDAAVVGGGGRGGVRRGGGDADPMVYLGPSVPQVGRAVNMRGPEGATVLRRHLDLGAFSLGKRLLIRAHFYDEGQRLATDEQHYFELLSCYGNPRVGLLPSQPGYTGPSAASRSLQSRSAGWHLFELALDVSGKWSAFVDGKGMGVASALESTAGPLAEIRLVASGVCRSAWASIEVIGLPAIEGIWPPATNRVFAKVQDGGQEVSKPPWNFSTVNEQGRWGIKSGVVFSLCSTACEEPEAPEEETAELDHEDHVSEEEEEEESIEDPPPPPHPAAPPRAKRRGKGKRRAKDPAMLTIECWSLGKQETDVERLDRVMSVFVERLIEAGMVLPENLGRIKECGEPLHPGCFIYSFGTRRVHIAVREGDAGRLALVVRCGGGFLDFADFARRHGSLEHLRFQRRPDSGGRQLIQLSSVLAGRTMRVKELSAAEN